MVELENLKVGDKVIWLGSSRANSYGTRHVEAIILKVQENQRIQIKIETPMGCVIKFVSRNSLDYAEK